MIKVSPAPKEVSRQAAYLVWALASALHEAWAQYVFDEYGALRGLDDLADIWTPKGEEAVFATSSAEYEREAQGYREFMEGFLRPVFVTGTLGGEWTRSFPQSRLFIRVTQRGFFYLERGGLHLWGTLGGEVHLEDREGDWGNYTVLKDLLLGAIALLSQKVWNRGAPAALGLLANALSALDEAQHKLGDEE